MCVVDLELAKPHWFRELGGWRKTPASRRVEGPKGRTRRQGDARGVAQAAERLVADVSGDAKLTRGFVDVEPP